jgi:hypothetical protein
MKKNQKKFTALLALFMLNFFLLTFSSCFAQSLDTAECHQRFLENLKNASDRGTIRIINDFYLIDLRKCKIITGGNKKKLTERKPKPFNVKIYFMIANRPIV